MLVCPAFRMIFLALEIDHSEFTVSKAVVSQPALNWSAAMVPCGWAHCCSWAHVSALSVYQH